MGLFGSDDSTPDDGVTNLVSTAKGDSVTRDRLTERKAGVVIYNLKKAPIIDFLDDEQPHFILLDKLDGLTVEDRMDRTAVEMASNQCAFAVLTDRRVLFLVGTDDDSVYEASLAYEDADSVDRYEDDELVVRGSKKSWEFSISSDMDDDEVDRATAFLEREIEGETSRDAIELETESDDAGVDEDEEPLLEVEPTQGPSVSVYPGRVVLDQEGGALTSEKHREFPMETITGVEYMAAGRINRGYVFFNRKGGSDATGALRDMEKINSADSVTFGRKQNDEFEELKDTVQRLVREQRGGSSNEQDQTKSAVETLKQRFAAGELSKEEYEERLELLQNSS